uniref:Ubiquitin-like modifier-activating enzyme ATG7 n=1 Tax=Panagrellus redivivus TaxID=6233 RepID=A0A7E4V3H4_PANRE
MKQRVWAHAVTHTATKQVCHMISIDFATTLRELFWTLYISLCPLSSFSTPLALSDASIPFLSFLFQFLSRIMVLQFLPLKISCDLSFWSELNRLKLEEWKLDESPRPIVATLPPDARSKTTYFLILDHSSLHPPEELAYNQVRGTLHLYNTLAELEDVDLHQKIQELAPSDVILNGTWQTPKDLLTFSLIMYADLKYFNYHVLTAVPSIILPQSFKLKKYTFTDADGALLDSFKPKPRQEFPVLWTKDGEKSFDEIGLLNPEKSFLIYHSLEDDFNPDAMHWQVPNLLFALAWNPTIKSIRIATIDRNLKLVNVKHFKLPTLPADENVVFYGWSQKVPQLYSLTEFFDRNQLMSISVDLNLKLTRWRMVPNLELDKFNIKVLIIGAGTLGCNLARGLMGWGLKNITFVDCGKVSVSNPVRQSLFIADDIGKPKAQAAAEALKRIYPTINSQSAALKVVMPGHPADDEEVLRDVDALDQLFSSHDFIFLCTDSRESRWLPTILALKHGKPVINIALGFDSFLVMRHGLGLNVGQVNPATADYKDKLAEIPGDQLGCYFCLDVTAPGDSTTNRTLDQQCTISRSGLSFTACGFAVELFASLVQHRQGPYAPARLTNTDENAGTLGGTPHQIRGFLRSYSMIAPTTLRSSVCSACGPGICSKLTSQEQLHNVVLTAVNDPGKLEVICGISKLQQDAENMEDDILTFGDSDTESV